MPTLDLALGLGMIGRTTDVLHISIVEPTAAPAPSTAPAWIPSNPLLNDGWIGATAILQFMAPQQNLWVSFRSGRAPSV